MKYPINADQVIVYLEAQCGKMGPTLEQLWRECLIPLGNDAYERGRQGLPLNSKDWISGWKMYYGESPKPDIAILLHDVMKLEKAAYKEGRQHSAATPVRLQKGSVAV